MKPQEIFERMKAKGVPGVKELVSSGAGDPFILVEPEQVPAMLAFLKDDKECLLNQLSLVSGVHYPGERFECVWHLLSIELRHDLVLKAHLLKDDPHVPTASGVHPTANWHERETFDLMGIRFDGHPDPRRIYLPEDWVGHPLRKDYVYPTEYNGMPLTDQNDPEQALKPAAAEASKTGGDGAGKAE